MEVANAEPRARKPSGMAPGLFLASQNLDAGGTASGPRIAVFASKSKSRSSPTH
jgi:hypothetical protein